MAVKAADIKEVDLTAFWDAHGNASIRELLPKKTKVQPRRLKPKVAEAFAAEEALKAITGSLSVEQRTVVNRTKLAELAKHGYEK